MSEMGPDSLNKPPRAGNNNVKRIMGFHLATILLKNNASVVGIMTWRVWLAD